MSSLYNAGLKSSQNRINFVERNFLQDLASLFSIIKTEQNKFTRRLDGYCLRFDM
jgi:hypothetical protein